MRCPHCTVAIHPEWNNGHIKPKYSEFNEVDDGYHAPLMRRETAWSWLATNCPSCNGTIIDVILIDVDDPEYPLVRERAYPRLEARKAMSVEVPESFKVDYLEACNVLSVSANASAALSRRVLEAVLRDQGYSGGSLENLIDCALSESSTQKVLPQNVREIIDAVRNLGNFAAHPIPDKSRLEIIGVEPDEAEWCLEIIEALFEHYYGKPSPETTQRVAKLNAKLADAGKPSKLGQ